MAPSQSKKKFSHKERKGRKFVGAQHAAPGFEKINQRGERMDLRL
jgi:hypothetical protein